MRLLEIGVFLYVDRRFIMATLKRKSAEGFEFVQMVGSDIVERVDSHLAETTQAHGGIMSSTGGTFSGPVAHDRNEVQQPKIKDYTEVAEIATGVTGSRAITLSNGNVFRHTLSGNTTYSITNPAASGQVHSFTLIITQPTTARTITWPAVVKWAWGLIPPVPTANKTAVYTFFTFDSGTTWIGSQAISEVTL